MSPHEALLSASGLRPMSAFVVVGSVVLAVALWVVRLAADDSEQPTRVRFEEGELPAYSIAARDGRTIARFVPRFDLELSPRSLWQAHTPRRMAETLARVLANGTSSGELLAAMLPDADASGEVRVEAWKLSLRQAQRVHDWIESGADTGRGPLAGLRIERDGERGFQLVWRPETVLGEAERASHGFTQAWRWARRIADGLYEALYEQPLDPLVASESQARSAREAIFKALVPTAFARAVRGIDPDQVLALRAALEAEGVAAWQMRIAYARDRVYPSGTDKLFGSWGYSDPLAPEAQPRDGLELVSDRLLSQRRYAFLDRRAERYRWIDDRPVRGERANGFLEFVPASAPPVVRTTLDLGLQRFLGEQLRDTLDTHKAALAIDRKSTRLNSSHT